MLRIKTLVPLYLQPKLRIEEQINSDTLVLRNQFMRPVLVVE
jgi:hypothetical protein